MVKTPINQSYQLDIGTAEGNFSYARMSQKDFPFTNCQNMPHAWHKKPRIDICFDGFDQFYLNDLFLPASSVMGKLASVECTHSVDKNSHPRSGRPFRNG